MDLTQDLHFVVAFLTVLCVLVFSWNALGRRVVNVVLGIQVLIGLILFASFAAAHMAFPQGEYVHIAGAFVALVAYGLAARFGRRSGGSGMAMGFSIVGLLCVLGTTYVGMRMYFGGHV